MKRVLEITLIMLLPIFLISVSYRLLNSFLPLCSYAKVKDLAAILSPFSTIFVSLTGLLLGLFYYFNKIGLERRRIGVERVNAWIQRSFDILQFVTHSQIEKNDTLILNIDTLRQIGLLFTDNAETLVKLIGCSIEDDEYTFLYDYFSYISSDTPSFITSLEDIERLKSPIEKEKFNLLYSNASSALLTIS